MLNKREIKKAKEKLNKFCKYEDNLFLQDEVLYEYQDAIEILLQYIDQLEQENKQYKEFIFVTGGKDIENITATQYMKIKQEGYIQGRIEEQDKLLKCINKQNKIIDEIIKSWKQDDARSIEELKKYFENKVEEK